MNSGDKDHFTTLIKPHLKKLYRLASRLTASVTDAEDLFQDVLTKVYIRRNELSSIRELSPWLGRVLYNQFVDSRRRKSHLHLVAEQETASSPSTDPEIRTDQAITSKRLTQALAKLSEEHRIVVLLHDSEGYKLHEIQELTGTPLGTLKSRLSRARSRLREILSANGTFSDVPACSSMEGVKNDVV